MCCGYDKIIISVSCALILILIIVLVIVITTNGNNKTPNILVTIANPGDNEETGTTTIKFSENKIVEGTALSHQEGSDIININEEGIYQISYQLFGIQETSRNI